MVNDLILNLFYGSEYNTAFSLISSEATFIDLLISSAL